MIIVDTSIWIDHLRDGAPLLLRLLDDQEVLVHPFVIGELALGNMQQRETFLARLQELPAAPVAGHDEVLALIHRNGLHGTGIGYVDAHLIASARMSPMTFVWTRDQKLRAVTDRLSLAALPHDA